VGILYGSAEGVSTAGLQLIDQDMPGVPGTSQNNDGFGWAVALADFTGDGHADLAAAARTEALGAAKSTGAVIVIPSGGSALTGTGSQWWSQSTAGVPGTSETDDYFGTSLAAGDVNGDGRQELAIGVGGESIGDARSAGRVVVLRGSASGLTATGVQSLSQSTPGVPGVSESGDSFGHAVAFGDFNGDGRDDLAVGTSNEVIGVLGQAGMVTVIYSGGAALTGTGAVSITQGTPGVPGANEERDLFGYWVAPIAAPTGTAASLVVGALGEGVGEFDGSGSVVVLKGAPGGVTGAGSVAFYPTGLLNGGNPEMVGGAFGMAFA